MNAADEILGPTLAQGRGDTIAILFGDQEITYAELNGEANRFANALRVHLETDDRVLLLMKDSPTFIAAYLGIMRAGGVAIGVNVRSAAKDLAFAIADSSARVALIDDDFLPLFIEATRDNARPPLAVVRGMAPAAMVPMVDLLAGASREFASVARDVEDMAFWLYTSGTTGSPKAAVHCHGDVAVGDWYLKQFGIVPGARVFSTSKLFFAFALGHTLLGGLRAGASIIVHEGWPDAAAVAQVVDRYRPTVMLAVPTIYRNLLAEGVASQPAFAEVATYVSAGEALPESLYNRWQAATSRSIIDGIGSTETIFMFVSGTPAAHKPGATGRPMPYAQVELREDDGTLVTTAGVPGVAWVKQGSLCRGYWRQPDKTAAAFRDGWFRSGDVFSIDAEGWWHHHGRGDDMLKISGQWVSPTEIEECALTVPGIAEAVAVGVANRDGLTRLALFLVAERGGSETLEQLVKDTLRANLSIYKCPRTIYFVDSVPRTTTGKVQRFRLRQQAAESAGGLG